ncbi:MAG: Arm DNA-binding domain-containing protein, partial [Candidatus Gastranaerophilaceae bacterium]
MSIRKRKTKNGYTWQIDCSNTTGERIRKSGFKTKADAEREYAKICLQVENGINVNKNKKIYFVDICDKFIKEHTEVYSKRSTIDNYNSYYNYQIKPFFKTLKLSEIT